MDSKAFETEGITFDTGGIDKNYTAGSIAEVKVETGGESEYRHESYDLMRQSDNSI